MSTATRWAMVTSRSSSPAIPASCDCDLRRPQAEPGGRPGGLRLGVPRNAPRNVPQHLVPVTVHGARRIPPRDRDLQVDRRAGHAYPRLPRRQEDCCGDHRRRWRCRHGFRFRRFRRMFHLARRGWVLVASSRKHHCRRWRRSRKKPRKSWPPQHRGKSSRPRAACSCQPVRKPKKWGEGRPLRATLAAEVRREI